MAHPFVWLMVFGFVLTTLAATAAYVIQECSWHELEELCERRQKQKMFGKIFDLRDQMRLGAEILQVISTALAASATIAVLMSDRTVAELGAWELISIFVTVAFGLIVSNNWIPWAVERIAAPRFLFHSWRWWWLVSALAWPFLVGGHVLSVLFARASGQDQEEEDEEEAFEDEILTMVSEGEHDGFLKADAREMIEGVMELGDTDVNAIMTPRSKIDAMGIDTNWDEMVEFVVESGRTRIPAFDEKIDNIVGILYAKDILRESMRSESKRRPMKKLLRQPLVVPGSTLLTEMLDRFLRVRVHMAIVRDEYGGLAGLVTIEDILEEIVGEIVDETDDERNDEFKRLNHFEADVRGTIQLNRLNQEMSLDLPEEEDFDTLSGFIMRELNEIPRVGRQFTVGNVQLSVIDANRRSVELVRIKVLDDDSS